MFKVSMVDSILMDEKLNIEIPNYINGRPTRVNALLIQTSIWLIQKNYMSEGDIHSSLIVFEQMIKTLNLQQQQLPLSEKVIKQALMPLNRAMPQSMLIMWCKKCWRYLECSEIKMKSGGNTKKKRPDDACIHCHTFEEFSDFFIFPHEFLCLLCNANDRMNLHDNIDRPNMKLRKTEIFNIASKKGGKATLESKKQYFYQVTQ
jgi:hypothetical protein